PRARIKLVGTTVADSTDFAGRFSMRGVLLGEYTMEIRTPSLDSVNAVHPVPIALTDSSASIELRVPTGTQLLSLLCGDRRLEWPGIVVGRVSSAGDSVPPRNTQVTAAWQQTFMPVGGQNVSNAGVHQQVLDTRADAHGVFRFCGVPTDKAISLT